MFKKFLIIILLLSSIFFLADCVHAETTSPNQPSLDMEILSSQNLSGTAGDYVTVKASIKNISSKTVNSIITYLSLVDEETKLPVDLEDWSADKGLFIGTIDAGQILSLDWKIHFVEAGKYSLIVVAEASGEIYPQTSSIVHFVVESKQNLNPSQVLPVALGTPIVILFIILLITYRRKSKLG